MNTWQILRQLQYLLRQQVWSGSATKVFNANSVKVTVAPDERYLPKMIVPMCLIRPLDAVSDPEFDEEPDLIMQNIALRLIVAIPGDAIGEHALIGANRQGQTDSRGRGLLELEEELFAAIELLNGINGVKIQSRAKSEVAATLDETMGYIALRDYLFEALVTADRFYHPAYKFAATTPGGGAVSLSWALPPARYDRYKMILRRAAGSTPPASPTAGTGVTLSGDLATSVADSPGAGTWSYALFAAYDETNPTPSAEQRYSEAVTKTVTAT